MAYLASYVASLFGVVSHYCCRESCRKDCVKSVNECVLNQENIKVIGFLGLVGKEPDVARGLLVDTGASINVHGMNWFEQFTKIVLQPWKLWSSDFTIKGASITGVEGRSVGTNLGQSVSGLSLIHI